MKTPGLSAIDAFLDSSVYRETQRMEEAQRSWIKNLQPISTLSEQLRLLTESTSPTAKMAEELQRVKRQQFDHIRTMLDPICDIRKSPMFDSSYLKRMEKIEQPSFLSVELERAAREVSQFDHVAKAMKESMQSSFSHAQEMLATTSIAGYLAQPDRVASAGFFVRGGFAFRGIKWRWGWVAVLPPC